MTTSHKQNPFGILEHSDSSDDDEFHKNKAKKQPQKETKTNDKSQKPKGDSKGDNAQKKAPLKVSAPDSNEGKEKHQKSKEARKVKGVSDEPHPLDRKSGTGISAFDKKAKRGGGGKFNVGVAGEEAKEGDRDYQEKEQVEEEVEDKSLTLQEYFNKQTVSTESQVNEAKAKLTTNDLLKEMGTATKLESRHEKQIDDKKELQRKKKEDYISTADLGLNTKNAELLGFKTGFKTFQDRKPLQEKAPSQPATEEGSSPDLKQADGEEKKDNQGKEQRGDGDKGEKKGGYKGKKPYNNNNNYKPREEKQVKPNFEDASAFPSLG